MTTPEQMYRRWIDAVWGRGDMGACLELMPEDVVDHNPVPGLPPGRAGHDAVLHMVRAAFPDAKFTIDVCLTEGALVAGRWTMTGTHTGTFAMIGLPPTGRPVRMTGQEIMRVEDGRFVEIWHNEDVAGLLAQLGVGGPPPG